MQERTGGRFNPAFADFMWPGVIISF